MNDNIITLLNDDCLKAMPSLPDKSIDLILCDLPYGVLNKGNDSTQWDCVIPLEPLWKQYRRIIKDKGAIILFSQGMFTARLMTAAADIWRYNIIWDKILVTGMLNAAKAPMRVHEDICVFYKNLPTYNPQMTKGQKLHSRSQAGQRKNSCYGHMTDFAQNTDRTDKYPISIVSFQKPHPSTAVHPTQKPVDLLRYLILTYSNEGDTVLDNTMGSGSTGVACVKEKRSFIGIEKDPKYFSTAERRINQALSQPPLF